MTRLYVDDSLKDRKLRINAEQAHYLSRVLRCREGDRIVVFNARGDERSATIESLAKRNPVIILDETLDPLPESPIRIILLQSLVKSDAMDLIVQKATELGVDAILAVRTEFSVIRLDAARQQSRMAHWLRVAHSACEQSGRHRPPTLEVFADLDAAIESVPEDCVRIAFTVDADQRLDPKTLPGQAVCVAIGPEGGFSRGETENLAARGFELRSLGPRTLRAETAAIAVCAGLQLVLGDLGAGGF